MRVRGVEGGAYWFETREKNVDECFTRDRQLRGQVCVAYRRRDLPAPAVDALAVPTRVRENYRSVGYGPSSRFAKLHRQEYVALYASIKGANFLPQWQRPILTGVCVCIHTSHNPISVSPLFLSLSPSLSLSLSLSIYLSIFFVFHFFFFFSLLCFFYVLDFYYYITSFLFFALVSPLTLSCLFYLFLFRFCFFFIFYLFIYLFIFGFYSFVCWLHSSIYLRGAPPTYC